MSYKYKHAVTGQTEWAIYPSGTSFNDGSKRKFRTVYVAGPGMFEANLSGMRVSLAPKYDDNYHGGKIPLWFTVIEWKNR